MTRISTDIVFEILQANHGNFVAKERLVAALVTAGLTPTTLGWAISKIRDALPDHVAVMTAHGQGYCLTTDPRVAGIAIPARGRLKPRHAPPPKSSRFYRDASPRYGR